MINGPGGSVNEFTIFIVLLAMGIVLVIIVVMFVIYAFQSIGTASNF